ncbi:unnamed protein product [Allacma fusca]|uniref:Uncharacterized protein n=1 Tax=Allacma fusca TaxID=39272 RepID=A0A8J2JQ96_9HEXA|nr:unnamed protein product [Allacma fusca]
MQTFNSNPSDQSSYWVATLKVNVNVDLNIGSKSSDNQVNQVNNTTKPQSFIQRTIVCLLFPFEITYFLVYTWFIRWLNIYKYFFPGRPKSLKNEIILVTGGANGIGREICRQIAEQEKDVAIVTWDADERSNLETLEMLKNLGIRKAFASTVDVSDREKVAAAAEKVRQNVGDVTILFNNTGVHSGPQNRKHVCNSGPRSIIGLARYFFFNRTITVSSIASKIIYGVRRRKEHIYIPEESRFLHFLADFFPEEVIGKGRIKWLLVKRYITFAGKIRGKEANT